MTTKDTTGNDNEGQKQTNKAKHMDPKQAKRDTTQTNNRKADKQLTKKTRTDKRTTWDKKRQFIDKHLTK